MVRPFLSFFPEDMAAVAQNDGGHVMQKYKMPQP
jgi:hypothetical protein